MNPRRNGHFGFTVTLMDSAQRDLRATYRRALAAGRTSETSAAYRTIMLRLRADAWDCGDFSKYLAGMKLVVRKVAVAPLVVVFGVHDDLPEVFVRNIIDMFGDVP